MTSSARLMRSESQRSSNVASDGARISSSATSTKSTVRTSSRAERPPGQNNRLL